VLKRLTVTVTGAPLRQDLESSRLDAALSVVVSGRLRF
jgi:hypothetical protein